MTRQVQFGQGLTEYGLTALFVGVVALGALTTLGNTLDRTFHNMAPTRAATVADAPAGPQAAPAPGTQPGVNGSNVADGHTVSLKMANGSTISLNSFPTDMKASVSTTGANGTTMALASTIQQMADQMVASGEITPAQASLLSQLANKGHEMASVEQLVENAAQQAPNWDAVHKAHLTLDGKTMTTWEWAALLGADYYGTKGGLRSDFDSLLKQVTQSGMLKDPTAKALVSQLSDQIVDIGQNFTNSVGNLNNQPANTPATNLISRVANSVDNKITIASAATSANSTGICKAGNGLDSGTHCSP